jgi:hypothetical protein
VELITRRKDGWPRLRQTVLARDGGCVATSGMWFRTDAATDSCRDEHGLLIRWDNVFKMELDHVRDDRGARLDDEAHLITVCPWHHRGSAWRIDTKARRQRERDVLRALYPEHWPVVE